MTTRDQHFVIERTPPDEWEWERRMRGFYAEPRESHKPAFYEVANDPLIQMRIPAR